MWRSQMSKIDDLIAAEGAEAETAQLPEDVKGERRNLGRSVMFSIRLNPGELAELERHADQRGPPAPLPGRGFSPGCARRPADTAIWRPGSPVSSRPCSVVAPDFPPNPLTRSRCWASITEDPCMPAP